MRREDETSEGIGKAVRPNSAFVEANGMVYAPYINPNDMHICAKCKHVKRKQGDDGNDISYCRKTIRRIYHLHHRNDCEIFECKTSENPTQRRTYRKAKMKGGNQ